MTFRSGCYRGDCERKEGAERGQGKAERTDECITPNSGVNQTQVDKVASPVGKEVGRQKEGVLG